MPRYIAFLRAVNVGGRIVKMDELRKVFEAMGLANVSTFIASGNVIFESRKTAAALETAIEKALRGSLGYDVTTMLRTPRELTAIVERVQVKDLQPTGVTLYVGFLKTEPAAAAVNAMAALSNDVDTLSVHGRELYWRCARSFSDSTVTGAKIEKLLKVPATIRNFTTVSRLAVNIPRAPRVKASTPAKTSRRRPQPSRKALLG